MSGTFYLHEDNWGMVELLPSENIGERQKQPSKRGSSEQNTATAWAGRICA